MHKYLRFLGFLTWIILSASNVRAEENRLKITLSEIQAFATEAQDAQKAALIRATTVARILNTLKKAIFLAAHEDEIASRIENQSALVISRLQIAKSAYMAARADFETGNYAKGNTDLTNARNAYHSADSEGMGMYTALLSLEDAANDTAGASHTNALAYSNSVSEANRASAEASSEISKDAELLAKNGSGDEGKMLRLAITYKKAGDDAVTAGLPVVSTVFFAAGNSANALASAIAYRKYYDDADAAKAEAERMAKK